MSTTDWSLSDLSDEQAERIAEVCELTGDHWAKVHGYYDCNVDLSIAAMIIRDWLDMRYDREPATTDGTPEGGT